MSFSTSCRTLPRVTTQPEQFIVTGTHLLAGWTKAVAVVLLVAVVGVFLLPPGWAWADDASSGGDGSDDTGIQVGAWALTVPYIIGKGAFALGGAVVGGLGYLFSGGDSDTAKTVWTKSIYGTYIIRPEHLRGEEPVYFLGKADESQAEATPPTAKSTPEPAKPEKK
jgi:hypothetical protein